MKAISITETSRLLGVSYQRVHQLLTHHRIQGAYKTERGWRIPLYGGKPKILAGKRGPKAKWKVVQSQKKSKGSPTIIHIYKQKIASNQANACKEPVIIVRQGSQTTYGCQVSFEGKCHIVYCPENQTKYGGAKVWIEVESGVPIVID